MQRLAILPILLSGSLIAADAESPWVGNGFLVVGAKLLDKDDAEPAENQVAGGAMANSGPKGFPLRIAAGALLGYSSGSEFFADEGLLLDASVLTFEARLGADFVHEVDRFGLALGAGIAAAFARADVEVEDLDGNSVEVSDSGVGFGFWATAMAYVRIKEKARVGIVLSWSTADVALDEVADEDLDAGGIFIGIAAGTGF